MADAIKVAQTRREDYKKDIAKKEAEIEELKELISDLDSFIEFGEALVSDDKPEAKDSEAEAKPNTVVSKPVVSKPSPQQAPRAVVSRTQDNDDEWGSDSDESNIARVLAART